jgi:hypothetical protein
VTWNCCRTRLRDDYIGHLSLARSISDFLFCMLSLFWTSLIMGNCAENQANQGSSATEPFIEVSDISSKIVTLMLIQIVSMHR